MGLGFSSTSHRKLGLDPPLRFSLLRTAILCSPAPCSKPKMFSFCIYISVAIYPHNHYLFMVLGVHQSFKKCLKLEAHIDTWLILENEKRTLFQVRRGGRGSLTPQHNSIILMKLSYVPLELYSIVLVYKNIPLSHYIYKATTKRTYHLSLIFYII